MGRFFKRKSNFLTNSLHNSQIFSIFVQQKPKFFVACSNFRIRHTLCKPLLLEGVLVAVPLRGVWFLRRAYLFNSPCCVCVQVLVLNNSSVCKLSQRFARNSHKRARNSHKRRYISPMNIICTKSPANYSSQS